MNDIIDAISARIKAPYFGYALLAFIGLNWRGIFLLTVTTGSPQARLDEFDRNTSFLTLIIYPLLVGALVTIATPWIRFFFNYISQKPFELIDNLYLEAEHKKTIKKTELERSHSQLFATKEEELIQRAKRDEEVSGIEDERLKEQLKQDIERLRRERDQMYESSKPTEKLLDETETELLLAAAKSGDGNISRRDYLSGRSINIGTLTFGEGSPREFSKYDSALKSLLNKALIQEVGQKGELFELTHAGWEIADTLTAVS